jgi:fused signal recognition particle receptor
VSCSGAAARNADLVLADTAGRLHTKVNLMEELRKVRRVAEKEKGRVTEVLLVLDAVTGQNGLVQAREFLDAVEVTGVVLTKLDGSAKGGIVLAIESELGIPVKLVGLGEGIGDLVAFDPDDFVDTQNSAQSSESARGFFAGREPQPRAPSS